VLKKKENIKTHFMFRSSLYTTVPFMEKGGKIWYSQMATDDNIIQGTRFACWVTKATDTHPEYAILNTFPLQQWLHERASTLRYTYIACLT
jgi:hypothetical protein